MPYVYSTLTNGNEYAEYEPGGADIPVLKKKVEIKGGANVANKKSLITPLGVATRVSDEDLEFLKNHPEFQRHMKAGYISIGKTNADPEKFASNMKGPDESAPLTPADFIAKSEGAKLMQGMPQRMTR